MSNYSRVKRGMVFWFNPDKVYGDSLEFKGFNQKSYKSHVQHGNRPWLVVSNDDGNESSPTCVIVPLTAEENKTNIPVHVSFIYEGVYNTILCEQPRTVDQAALKDYIYTLDDSLMSKVEKAQQIQFSIRPLHTYADFSLENVVDHLKSIVDHIIQEKTEILKQQPIPVSKIEDAAIELGGMLEDLVGMSLSTTQSSAQLNTKQEEKQNLQNPTTNGQSKVQHTRYSQIDKFNQKLEKSQQLQSHTTPKVETTCEKPKRNSWTKESRQQYLNDCETMTPQEIMKKYHFKNTQSVFQTKYACKNALGIIN